MRRLEALEKVKGSPLVRGDMFTSNDCIVDQCYVIRDVALLHGSWVYGRIMPTHRPNPSLGYVEEERPWKFGGNLLTPIWMDE